MIAKVSLILLSIVVTANCIQTDSAAKNGFANLDKYLDENVEKKAQPEEYLKAATDKLSNVGLFESNSIKAAIEALLKISSSHDCDSETLKALNYALSGGVDLRGSKRIELLIAHYTRQFAAKCDGAIEQNVTQLVGSLDQDKLKSVFAPVVNINTVTRGRGFNGRDDFAVFTIDAFEPKRVRSFKERVFDDLVDLSRNDGLSVIYDEEVDSESGEVKRTLNTKKIRSAVSKYLAEPCRYYVESVSPVMNEFFAYLETKGNLDVQVRHFMSLPRDLTDPIYHFRRCQIVLSLSQKEIDNLKHEEYAVEDSFVRRGYRQ